MSIYATLWRLQFPRHGDDHSQCRWIDVIAQGVPEHIGRIIHKGEVDLYAAHLPSTGWEDPSESESRYRAVVFVTNETRKGTGRCPQEYDKPHLTLSGVAYREISFAELHEKLCDALREDRPRFVSEWHQNGQIRIMFEDGSSQDFTP